MAWLQSGFSRQSERLTCLNGTGRHTADDRWPTESTPAMTYLPAPNSPLRRASLLFPGRPPHHRHRSCRLEPTWQTAANVYRIPQRARANQLHRHGLDRQVESLN